MDDIGDNLAGAGLNIVVNLDFGVICLIGFAHGAADSALGHFGILFGHAQSGHEVAGYVARAHGQSDDGLQHIVFIDRDRRGLGAEVDKGAADLLLVGREHEVGLGERTVNIFAPGLLV